MHEYTIGILYEVYEQLVVTAKNIDAAKAKAQAEIHETCPHHVNGFTKIHMKRFTPVKSRGNANTNRGD